VWGPKLGVCKHVFAGYGFHEGAITALASHPTDGNLLLTGAWRGGAGRVMTFLAFGIWLFFPSPEKACRSVGRMDGWMDGDVHNFFVILLKDHAALPRSPSSIASCPPPTIPLMPTDVVTHAGGMDGTARLLHLANKRVLATLVHCEPKALADGGAAAAASAAAETEGEGDGMEVEGEGEEDEDEEGGEVREEASFSVETVGFSHVFNWCATGTFFFFTTSI
jgi:hypothetical protein